MNLDFLASNNVKSTAIQNKKLLKNIIELKELGLSEVHLDDIDLSIALDSTKQITDMIKMYPALGNGYLGWFGTTQALYQKDYEGRLNSCIKSLIAFGSTPEQAAYKASESIKKQTSAEFATCHPNFTLTSSLDFDREYSIPHEKFSHVTSRTLSNLKNFNAITINADYAKSCKDLKAQMRERVKFSIDPPYSAIPVALVVHEAYELLNVYIETHGLADIEAQNSLKQAMNLGKDFICKNLCQTAAYSFNELVATGCVESYFSPNPRPLARLARMYVDNSLQRGRIQKDVYSPMKNSTVLFRIC